MRTRTALLLAALAFGPACTCGNVPPGNVGIVVHTTGSDKGSVDVVGIGRQYLGPTDTLYLFPTFKQTYTWTKSVHEGKPHDESIHFQTKEGLSVGADVGITYHIDEKKVVELFKAYRRDLEEITDTFIHNLVRDAMNEIGSKMEVESVYGVGKADFMKAVTAKVKADVEPLGIIVEQVSLTADFDLPPEIRTALTAKLAATQRAMQRENELRETEAQAKKTEAEAKGTAAAAYATAEGEAKATLARAEAQAKANDLLSRSLTPQLIELKRLETWNGVLPTIVGGSAPLMDISSLVTPAKKEK